MIYNLGPTGLAQFRMLRQAILDGNWEEAAEQSHRNGPSEERNQYVFDLFMDAAEEPWLFQKRGIEPHIPVIDKSGRKDGTFERADFIYDAEQDVYTCPGGKELKQNRRTFKKPRENKPDEDGMFRYRSSKADCDDCTLKARCCPKDLSRKVTRSVYEPSRDVARAIARTTQYAISCKLRKKVEMLFAHLKRILGLNRLRLRGPCGAHDEFHLAATAQNLRKLAKLLPTSPIAWPA
jgi:hypothetical protein